MLRILYFGLPGGALALAEDGLPPVAAVVGPLDLPGRRRLRRTLSGSLLLGMPKLNEGMQDDAPMLELLRSVRPDAILSFFWPQRIPSEVLRLAPRGAFGTHPSLLPRWRGPDPYYWALRSGDTHTGVTLHRLQSTYDTGAIVDQRSIAIHPSDDAWSLAKRLDRPALALLRQCARDLAAGHALEGEAQDEAQATPAPAPSEEDLSVDWQDSAEATLRRIRAAGKHLGATANLAGQTVEIAQARLHEGDVPLGLRPAEAFRTQQGWAVRCGEGAVLLVQVRDLEGQDLPPESLFVSSGS